jgi:hypothetical protein
MALKVKPEMSSKHLVREVVLSELNLFEQYRNESEHDDDVEFWRHNNTVFPNLFHVFVQSRGARPSTARVESDFSIAGSTVPSLRESIGTDTLNDLFILKTHPIDLPFLLAATSHFAHRE